MLQKLTDGAGAEDFGAGPFLFIVDCTLDTGAGSARVWAGFISLVPNETREITGIAAGASCAVVETLNGGATAVSIDPDPVVIEDGATVEVIATNTFDAVSLTVSKQIEGEGAELWGTGPFEVTLECLRPLGGSVAIPRGAVRQLTAENGYTTTFDTLLTGLLCTISETDAGGATSQTITDADGEPVDGLFRVADEDLAFTVTNTFDTGSFTVTKTVSGDAATANAGSTFTILTRCEWNGAEIPVPGGDERTISDGETVSFDDLPVGAVCDVREVEDGGASAVTFTPADPADPAQALVEIGADAAASVTIDNRFDLPDSGGGDPPLPATGMDPVRIGAITALGMLLVALGMLVVRRRRQA